MYVGKLIFAQVMEFAPWHTFRRLVAKYGGDFNVRSFRCLDQFFCMAFAQLTYRESLRDIEACLGAQPAKLYHLGLRGNVTRSNLADANELRDWRIYCDFAHALIRIARRLYAGDPLAVELLRQRHATMCQRTNARREFWLEFALRNSQFVAALEVDPEFSAHVEVQAEPHGSIHGDRPAILDDVGDPAGRHVNVARKLTRRKAQRFEKILQQDFARRNFR